MKPETKAVVLILSLSVIWKNLLLLTGWVEGFLGKYPLLPILGFMLIGMFRAMEERRKISFPKGIPFKDAFRCGMSVNALFALVYSLFVYLYLNFLDSGFRQRFSLQRVEDMRKQNTPQADIDAWVQTSQQFPFEMTWVLFTFIGVLVLGVFYAAIMARMMNKKYPVLQA
jgi:hypothetical protein